LVTGSEGFLGRHLVKYLTDLNATVYTVVHTTDPSFGADLVFPEQAQQVIANAVQDGPVDYVFNLAGYNGNIQFNINNPADIFYKNTVMGLNVIRACAFHNVEKVISLVASCAYPTTTYVVRWDHEKSRPTAHHGVCNEENFFGGLPDFTVAAHGLAKRNIQLASHYYSQQYGINAICACPTTIYGPGDYFSPERTKVMSGLVQRFVEATRREDKYIEIWGTGKPLREFIYVNDCVDLLVRTALQYDRTDKPLNLGTGQELTISQLAYKIKELCGYKGEIVYDTSKPDGQFRKRLDLSRMRHYLGEVPKPTPLDVGIAATIKYYQENF
jgi:GDP-L-fucose synthase